MNGDRIGVVFISVRFEKFWFVLKAGNTGFTVPMRDLNFPIKIISTDSTSHLITTFYANIVMSSYIF